MKAAKPSGSWGLQARAALGASLVIASCCAAAHASSITVQHAKGETVVAMSPKHTAVFDLASLDTLHALGVDVAGVPAARFTGYLSHYSEVRYAKVGTLFEPDYDAIKALDPGLIIVGGRSSAKHADLAKMAPTIDMTVDTQDFFGSVQGNVRKLANIYGKQDQAEVKLDELKSSIAALKEKTAKAGPGLLILAVGDKMSAFGPNSRFGMIYDTLGVTPALADLNPKERNPISMQALAKANPEWLYVIDRNAATGRQGIPAKTLLDNDLISGTSAGKKNQIVYLDPVDWYLLGNAGLTSLQQSVDQIATTLDPLLQAGFKRAASRQ